ncbi:hypothetical protein B0H10DRAFT_2224719 [Mycena sp. CBHHK59/15]|nr:hypothetical protein B0H10DRAFT_2224719 [Mycena sp. CBHHK59/15]
MGLAPVVHGTSNCLVIVWQAQRVVHLVATSGPSKSITASINMANETKHTPAHSPHALLVRIVPPAIGVPGTSLVLVPRNVCCCIASMASTKDEILSSTTTDDPTFMITNGHISRKASRRKDKMNARSARSGTIPHPLPLAFALSDNDHDGMIAIALGPLSPSPAPPLPEIPHPRGRSRPRERACSPW